MGDLAGFFVLFLLVLPRLLVLAAYVAVFFLLVKLTKRKGFATRIFAPIIGLTMFHLVLYADQYLGIVYVKWLCTTDDLLTVNETVELPRSYWDSEGWPRFHAKEGRWQHREFLPEALDFAYQMRSEHKHIDSVLPIAVSRKMIVRSSTEKVLVHSSLYGVYRGRFERKILGTRGQRVYSCGSDRSRVNEISGSRYNDYLTSWVFIPDEPINRFGAE